MTTMMHQDVFSKVIINYVNIVHVCIKSILPKKNIKKALEFAYVI